MNITLVNTNHFYGGGDSTYTFNLSALLKRHGHNISFFAMQDEKNIADPNADLFVQPINFKELNTRKSLINGLSVLKRVIYYGEARQRFSELLNRVKPDIIHLQNIHGHISPSIIFEAKKRNIPVVWTLHDYKLICPNSHFLIDGKLTICEACKNRKYYNACLNNCKKGSILASTMAMIEAYAHQIMGVKNLISRFITPSAFLSAKLIEYDFPPEKVTHIPLFLPKVMLQDVSNDQGYLLFMARLSKVKGIYTLLQACNKLRQVKVIIVGRIDENEEQEIRELLPGNVQYHGMQQGEHLKNLLMNCRAVVLPSICYENQPFSITEAFAVGKPVIASDLGGMSELVKNGERGLLVPPGDAVALAEAMQWMWENPTKAHEMGAKAREYALIEHREDEHYRRILRIYEEVIP